MIKIYKYYSVAWQRNWYLMTINGRSYTFCNTSKQMFDSLDELLSVFSIGVTSKRLPSRKLTHIYKCIFKGTIKELKNEYIEYFI